MKNSYLHRLLNQTTKDFEMKIDVNDIKLTMLTSKSFYCDNLHVLNVISRVIKVVANNYGNKL